MNAVYRLKPMVAARLLAEITALLLLASLPVFLLLHGNLGQLSMVTRVLAIAAGVVSLMVLPAYGFVTYKVSVDDDALRTFSLFKKQAAPWGQIKTVQLKTSWGWRRYVVKAGDGELSFPIWLINVQQLLETVRTRLPDRGSVGGGGAGARTFLLAPTAVLFQCLNVAGSMLFVGLFWMFFANMSGGAHKPLDPGDRLIILIACAAFTAVIAARALFFLLSSRKVVSDPGGLQISNWLFQRAYPWSDLVAAGPSWFLLPEGLIVKTKRGWFIVGDQLDAFDELQEDLAKKLPPPAVAQK